MEILANRVWAEVDLRKITENYRKIKNATGKDVLCVIKADGYGHGSVEVAKALSLAGASFFAVATFDEALELRRAGIEDKIMLLGYFDVSSIEQLIFQNITVSIFDIESAKTLSDACVKIGKRIKVHIKIDTGMSRLGFLADEEIVPSVTKIANMEGIDIEGIYTHFAVSDDDVHAKETLEQFNKFKAITKKIEENGIKIPIKHCANSGAVLQYDYTHLDMVRAGIVLYGYSPDESLGNPFDLSPALTLKARIAQVKWVEAGKGVSYGLTYTLDRKSKIGVVTIGYADGLLRSASKGLEFSVGGQRVKLIGRICMDMCMVDLTDCEDEVSYGDEVIIFGNGENAHDAGFVAKKAGTITYEVLCAISRRVARVYK